MTSSIAQKKQKTLTTRLSGTNLEHVGDHNFRVTFQAIRVHGAVTRTKLVALTGLATPSIANITNRLLDAGLIKTIGKVQGVRGQPPKLLTINPDGCFSIGVNIDRDHLTCAIIDLAGQVRARHTQEINFAMPDQVAAFFRKAVSLMQASEDINFSRLIGIGVAVPHHLSHIGLPKLPKSYAAWDQIDIPSLFSGVVDGPVLVENDATAAALGELQFGRGLRKPSFFYILISAGLGGGLVIEGTLFRGAHGHSGEIGFIPLGSHATNAQDIGEAVSLQGLYNTLRNAGIKTSTPEALLDLSPKGQRIVEDWLDAAAGFLTPPLLSISSLIDPQAVFIGGRLPEVFLKRLIDRLNEHLHTRKSHNIIPTPVLPAALGGDAPVIGAALLPINERLLPTRNALMATATND